MRMRVSQLVVQAVLLDEFDAPQQTEPVTFSGDGEGTAADKLRDWLDDLPKKLEDVEK